MVQKPEIEVVISGIGGYFPRSINITEFQDLLLQNVHAQDPARWRAGQLDVCDLTSNVPDIDRFDASYFGIHRQQCTYMDPMQRSMLEKTFEAIIDAGLNPSEVRGKKIGVYMGSCISENDSLMFESVENGFGITGQARTMLANRISYWLNVTGPSCSFDASWTNGVQVLQLAIEAIQSGQCEAAVIGTTNLALNIYPAWLYRTQGYTSIDGYTRAFDENAEGYLRGEAIIALYVQRADQCKRSYATVVHADAQYNGIREGNFAHIDRTGLTRFLEEFYKHSDVKAEDVSYVETYGCGIKKIDESELGALDAVYCKSRKEPLLIGSVKTNTGHAEASESLVSLVKVIIAMETGTIPATLHHKNPNKNIKALIDGRMEVVTENRPWVGEYAAINSIGLSSIYGHILLKRNKKAKVPIDCPLPRLNIVSTRTEEGVKEILKVLNSDDTKDIEYSSLVNRIFTNNIPGHLYRGYVVRGEKEIEEFAHFSGSKPPVWFIYSGMGSQWATMGKDLMAIPLFAESINKSHDVLLKKGIDLKNVLTSDDPAIFENILNSFIGIAAVQIALTDILRTVGIVPDGLIGHSVGELGCAYADGCLTAEQMILSAYYRGKASLESGVSKGMMAAIGMGAEELAKIVPPTIDVACHNGPDSSTLSGPTEDMTEFVAKLKEKGVFARLVNVSNIAYHSRYIKPAAPLLLKYLQDLISTPVARSSKWIATSIQQSQWNTDLAKTVSAEYLTNNLLSSVYFAEGCKHIPQGSVAIEIAPHGLLQAILRRSLAGSVNVALTKRGTEQPVEFLMSALGKLYLNGLNLELSGLYPTVNYPISRGTKSLTPLVRWEHSGRWRTGLDEFKDYSFTEKYYLVTINNEEFRNLVGHQIDGKIVIPVTAYLMLVVDVLSNVKRVESAVFENIFINKNISISHKDSVPITIMVQRGSGDFEISEGQNVVVSGNIVVPEDYSKEVYQYPEMNTKKGNMRLASEEFYNELENRGYDYREMFKSVKDVEILPEGSKARVKWPKNWPAFLSSMIQLELLHAGEAKQNLLMPSFIRRVLVNLEQVEDGTVFDVDYHIATNMLTSKVAQISGVKFDDYLIENKNILINDFRYVSFMQEEVTDLQVGLNVFFEILLQNVNKVEDLEITEVKDKYGSSFEPNIKAFFDQRCGKPITVNIVDTPEESMNIAHSSVIILPYDSIKEAYLLLNQHADFVIVTLPSKDSLYLSYPLNVVSTFIYENNYYHLLRKANQPKHIIVDIPNDNVTPNEKWINEVKKAVSTIKKGDNTRVFLVKYDYPIGGIESFTNKVKCLVDSENLRYIFILDKGAPPFHLNEDIYKAIIQQDLRIAVFDKCQWGIYMDMIYQIPIIPKITADVEFTLMVQKGLLQTPKLKIEYINFDPRDFSRGSSVPGPKREYVGYSGVTSDGSKVMGIAKLDLQDMKFTPDPYFQWPVPEHWSMIDAASCPYAYAMAFNVLVEVTQIESREIILIHDGCSSFGQAAIAIAHYLGCFVYTTVGSEQQRAFLKSRNAQLTDRNIFNYNDCNFEKDVMMATAGEGVNVVLNCFGGDRLRASIRCLSRLSRLIHYRINDIDETDFIGLGVFLKCTCMAGIIPRKLFEISPDLKKKLHDLVADGLKTSFIKPIERKIFTECNTEEIEKYLEDPTFMSTPLIKIADCEPVTQKKSHQAPIFKCDKASNYVVYGDQSETWLHTVEWLIFHGAKKVFVVTTDSTNINRRLNLLKQYHDAQIKIIGNSGNPTEIASSIAEISKQGPLDAVFILPSKDNSVNLNIANSVDAAMAKKNVPFRLVCIWGTDEECKYKSNNGRVKVYNIRWEENREFKELLKILDRILEIGADILLKNEQVIQQDKLITIKDFSLLFPNTIRSLINLSDDLTPELQLDQLTSSCPRVVREIPPVFLIPGLEGRHCQDLKYMVERLMYPVHCVRYGQKAKSIEEIADEAVKEIVRIQPEGPYSLIGVSWGGSVTLEVAARLEAAKAVTRIFLVDAVPDTIQAVLHSQQEHLEAQILSHLLNITEYNEIMQLQDLKDWTSRVEAALKLAKVNERDREPVQIAAQLIKQHVQQILDYQYQGKGNMINGATMLFRPYNASKDDSFGLNKYCKQVEIQVMTGNHSSMMQEDSLIEYINDNVAV